MLLDGSESALTSTGNAYLGVDEDHLCGPLPPFGTKSLGESVPDIRTVSPQAEKVVKSVTVASAAGNT